MGFVVCGGNGSEMIFVAVIAATSRFHALHTALSPDAQLYTSGFAVDCVTPDQVDRKFVTIA